jgi:ATP-dependent DNA helicase PIF1
LLLFLDEAIVYNAIDSDPAYSSLLNTMCTAKEVLVLKRGSQVMLNKNIELNNGLVNGSRGVVTGFCDIYKCPIVRFFDGTVMTVKLDCWSLKLNSDQLVTRKQIPLQLAWALSIHKSQGMTLDCAQVSLSRVFENGQAYVALSRAKSLKNLKITDFDVKAIKASDAVLEFYRNIDFHTPMKQSRLAFDDC